MPLLFANPWGLLALLGIPVVLAIHFLHRHRQAIPVSTLFLIEIAREPARSGRRWHRLLPSVPMWLQLLLVLLLAALLARPYLPQGVLRVAVVVDGSASMSAFRDELAARLTDLDRATTLAGRPAQWLVLPANPAQPRLYAGEDPGEWIRSLATWSPAESWRDPSSALRLARDRVGPEGLVVYATDTPRSELAGGAALLAVGRPLANAAVAGVTVEESAQGTRWQAVVVNPNDQPAGREWTLQWNGSSTTAPQAITIPPRGMATLSGELPENATRCVLRLSPDEFPLDDVFPFVRAAPKPLAMATRGDLPKWLAERMLKAIPRLSVVAADAADFIVAAVPEGGEVPSTPGLVVSAAGGKDSPFGKHVVAPSSHPLVSGLSWAGLSIQEVPAPAPASDDVVLLWAGEKPLASLRAAPQGPQLIFHFNPVLSNFDRLPAGAILLLRFAESIRAAKSATAWEQLEPGQFLAPLLPEKSSGPLTMETLEADGSTRESKPLAGALRAPDAPGFLRVRDAQSVAIEAAVAFADTRESDFRACALVDETEAAIARAARIAAPSDDFTRPLLALLALAALLVLYHFTAVPTRPEPTESAEPSTAA